jgi:4-methylaminobutanoate oxidase (formaldehyde-forming)
LAGFYVKEDGRANPVDCTMSMAKGARMRGARFFENARVDRVLTKNGGVCGVRMEDGHVIECEYVLNCAGMWARQLGAINGVNIPNQAAEHYYLVTEAMDGVDPNWPVIEDPACYTYIRPEGAGLMVGLFEPVAAAWNVGKIPAESAFTTLAPDLERMAPFVEKAMSRVPALLNTGIKTFFCGPESFTPDLAPVLGEAPEIRRYFVAAGLNSIGILSGGGVGRAMAHWIVNGRPDIDITGSNIDRLHAYQATPMYREHRVVESLGMTYACHYPSKAMHTARNVKRSPLHDRLVAKNAYLRDVSGWESPGWYAPAGVKPEVDEDGRTGWWERENWFPYWAAEHKACRESVALIDMSFMSKFSVRGRDAGRILNRLCTANVDGPVNTITYTQMLNAAGCVEADITINKLGEEEFMVVATDTAHRHVLTLLRRGIEDATINGACPPGSSPHAFVSDVTGGYAQINIQGPNARKLMQACTDADMSDAAFPFRSSQQIAVGYAVINCVRLTYVGELGYELYVPTEQATHVYDHIVATDKKLGTGLTHCGLRALGSLRMEKAYKDYGHDVDNTDSVLEAALGFTCDFTKPNGFIGKEAVEKEKNTPGNARRRLMQVLVKDPWPLLYHGEPIYRNNKVCGTIRSSSYGHTLGGAVGLAMIDAPEAGCKVVNKEFMETGTWEIEIGAKRYPCVVSTRPMYDPNNAKIKL